MTAQDLMRYELDDAHFQLLKVFHGLSDELKDARPTEKSMSPRETLAHLCDCYQAVITETSGGTHEWGSFKIENTSWENLWSTFKRMRAEAVQRVLTSEEDKALKMGYAYICAHDAYHVGQISALRVLSEPEWDPYSIYNMG